MQWLEDNRSRPTSVTGVVEGADPTYGDLTQPSRVVNITQIITQPIRISRTVIDTDTAGMSDPWVYQKAKALKQLKNKMEFAILNSTKASGSSGIARSMDGIDAFITTHTTARNSGTSFSEAELNEMANECYNDVGDEDVFDMVLCPINIKTTIAGFDANQTRWEPASNKRLIRDVLVYESSAGTHKVFAHRDVRNSAGTVTVYGLKEDLHKVSYFQEPKFQEFSPTGDARKGQWLTEMTLEELEERADIKRTGYEVAPVV